MTALVLALAGCAPSVGRSDVAVSGGVVAEGAVRGSVVVEGTADLIATDRATLVAVMTRWCEVCRREQPELERWARSHADVRTVVVVSGSPRADVDALVAERRLDVGALSIVADPSGGVADGLGVTATPALLLFAPGGAAPTGRYTRVDELPPVGGRGAGAGAAGVEGVTDTGTELGTSYDALVLGPQEQARRDLADARTLVRELGAQLSEWNPDSELSRVNREAWPGPVVLSPTLRRIIAGAIHVSRQTGGAFDITWASLGEPREGDDRALAALAGVGSEHLILDGDTLRFGHPATRIGLGGVAKGDIIDAAFLLLRSRGYASIVVNIGGDLRTAGRDEAGKRRFEIVDPYHPQEMAGSIEVDDTAIATSGNYLRRRRIGGQVVGHIIDPRTGRPPAFDGSVTVLTRDAAMADALATALFVMGPEEGLGFVGGLEGVEAIFVTRDGVKATVPVESR